MRNVNLYLYKILDTMLIQSQEKIIIQRINEWICKGDHEKDPFNRFFSYWTAFNAFRARAREG